MSNKKPYNNRENDNEYASGYESMTSSKGSNDRNSGESSTHDTISGNRDSGNRNIDPYCGSDSSRINVQPSDCDNDLWLGKKFNYNKLTLIDANIDSIPICTPFVLV